MNDPVTVKDAAKAVATSKALLAAIIGSFTLMSAVGLAILEWRINVNVAIMEWGAYLETLDECNNP